jgi:predicted dehydrogenase
MTRKKRVLLLGLGTIAATHLAVLNRREDIEIVGGVDPRPGGEDPSIRRWARLDDALATTSALDVVVVATPTDTHIEIAKEVLERTDALVLCEKPLARGAAQIGSLEATLSREVLVNRLKVAHHFAFSPEVEWAHALVEAHPEWGQPTGAMCVFNDAYSSLPPDQLDSYVSSWVDSGPNQLSVLSMFVRGWTVDFHTNHRDRSLTSLSHEGGTTLLTSNWIAGDTSKQTTLEFHEGAIRIRIDHTSMTALRFEDGLPVEHVGYADSVARKDAHYIGLYQTLLSDPADVRLGVSLAKTIATVLENADALPPTSRVTMSTISAAD